jgi:hypothetical protein
LLTDFFGFVELLTGEWHLFVAADTFHSGSGTGGGVTMQNAQWLVRATPYTEMVLVDWEDIGCGGLFCGRDGDGLAPCDRG